MNRYSYSLPDEARFEWLRQEAKRYLDPAGFAAGHSPRSTCRLTVEAGKTDAEHYAIERRVRRNCSELHVRSDGLGGATHGFYHALRLLGFGFSFFADVVPKKISLAWTHRASRIEIKPAFDTRGFLPWHNFLSGPTTWNTADYERYLQTMRRWGGNLALFHQYDTEPLAAMRNPRGEWTLGRPAQTTFDGPWGATPGVRTSDFAHGTANHFPDSRNGAWSAAHRFQKDPIAAAQDEFARVCAFGKSIGVEIAFGFELSGDPTAAGAKEQVRRRIGHVLAAYPALAVLCLWQPEGLGVWGWRSAPLSPGYGSIHRQYAAAFPSLRDVPSRLAEAVRIADWFSFAHRVAREIRPSMRVAFAGWGGDKWMRWGDSWEGLHQILPPDIVLAQHDNLDPLVQDGVSRVAAALRGQRELWSIPWIESDSGGLGRGSLWHPQESLAQMEKLARSARAIGYRGLLGYHWQTAGVELSASHLMAAAWDTRTSAHEFRLRYARTFFSARPRRASKAARILNELEQLGPGWTGTSQQSECGTFAWNPHPALTRDALPRAFQPLRKQLTRIRDAWFEMPLASPKPFPIYDALRFCLDSQCGQPDAIERLRRLREQLAALRLGTAHARRWRATIDFVLAYEQIKQALHDGGGLAELKNAIRETKAMGLKPDPRVTARYEKELGVVEDAWKKVFAAQEARLDTRGDFGNLANLNIKAYQAWKRFREEQPSKRGRAGYALQSKPTAK